MKRIVSLVMAILIVVSIVAMAPAPVSATSVSEGYVDVAEISSVTLYNLKTKQYMNFDYGICKNGQPLRCWPWDGSKEQIFNIDKVKSGVYRIVTNKNKNYAVDVYRGNSKLKAGQLCDIWKAGDDATAQNLKLYRCSDGSYILRMAGNTDLAIASAGSKGRLKLVKFNAKDTAQRWVFKNTSGKNVDIRTSAVKAVAAQGIPAGAYQKTKVVYTVSGTSYYQAKTTREYNDVPKGTLFYLDKNDRVVTNATILNKLFRLQVFNSVSQSIKDIAIDYADAADKFYDIYAYIQASEKFADVMGKSLGIVLSASVTGPFSIKNAAIEVSGEIVSEDTAKMLILSTLTKAYSANSIYYGNLVANKMQGSVTDYDRMLAVWDAYVKCFANHAALRHLVGDDVYEKANSGVWKETSSYLYNVVIGFADSIIPDVPGVDLIQDAVDGILSIGEFAVQAGAERVYEQELEKVNKIIMTDYANTATAEALARDDWDAKVGTTVAKIKSGSSYTKYYGSKNVSYNAGYVGQCTWYALGRFYEVTGINLGKAPHAKYWLSTNKNNKSVKVVYGADKIASQSIAVDTSGTYGHVLFIEHVTYNSNGTPKDVYFTECNWDGNGTYNANKDCVLQKLTFKQFKAQRSPDGYIIAK